MTFFETTKTRLANSRVFMVKDFDVAVAMEIYVNSFFGPIRQEKKTFVIFRKTVNISV